MLKIQVSTGEATPGAEVTISVDMLENSGCMAMSFAIPYDTSRFEFVKYQLGRWNSYCIVNLADKGYVAFCNIESKDRKYVGTIFSLTFKVKENTPTGYYGLDIHNIRPDINGDSLHKCFVNKNLEILMPEIVPGGIWVKEEI